MCWPNLAHRLEILAFPFTNADVDTKECMGKLLAREAQGSNHIRLMEPVEINGPDTHPVFAYLKAAFNLEEIKEDYPSYFLVDPVGVPAEVHHGAGYKELKEFMEKHLKKDL